MSTIARFTLVEILTAADGHASVRPWTPAAYEQPGLASAHKTVGVTTTTSDYPEPVVAMRRGTLRDVARQNGETWAVGDVLWAKSDGSITKTRPAAPLPFVLVGTVFETVDVLHTIDVDVRVLPSMGELSGVSVETPALKDVFIYNATTHCWEPRRLVAADLYASATDVLFGRATAAAGDGEQVACTAAGRAILDDANAAAQLVTLGAVASAGHTMTGRLLIQLITEQLRLGYDAGNYCGLAVDASGNIQLAPVGTNAQFQVYSASEAKLVRFTRSAQYGEIGIDIAGANYGVGIWHNGTQQATIYDTGLVLGSYVAAGADPPTGGILASGMVGIRDTTPTAYLDVNSDILRLRTAKTPASGAAGNAGDICWDANYFYIWVAANTPHRVAHAAY